MANEKFTQLPTVASSTLGDIIAAVQGGVSSQETLQQVFNLMLSNTILHFAGNPNGLVAGQVYQLCYDTTNNKIYVCTTSGTALTAVWTLASAGAGLVVPAQGGTGVPNPTQYTLPVAQGAFAFDFLGPLTNGQLLIGATGGNPVPATITAGTNISVTNSPGGIQIGTTGPGAFGWLVINTPTENMVPGIGYIADNFAGVAFTLPTISVAGDQLSVVGKEFGGWSVQCNGGQNIQIGANSTSVAGSIASTNQFDSVNLVCTVDNTTWTTVGAPQGNLTIL